MQKLLLFTCLFLTAYLPMAKAQRIAPPLLAQVHISWQQDTIADKDSTRYLFNSFNKLGYTSEFSYIGGEWQQEKYTDYSYGNGGVNLYSITTRVRDNDTWVNSTQIGYVYQSPSWIADIYSGTWDGVQWLPVNRANFTNDTLARTRDIVFLLINPLTGNWTNLSRTQDSLDAQLRQLQATQSSWNGGWNPNSRFTYTYYGDTQPVDSIIEYEWQNGAWVLDDITKHYYDAAGNLTYQLEQNSIAGNLVNATQIVNDIANGHIVTSTTQVWTGTDWLNLKQDRFTYADTLLMRKESFDWTVAGVWQRTDTWQYYYDIVSAAPAPIGEQAPIRAFPNPATHRLHLEQLPIGGTLSILTPQGGHLLTEQPITESTQTLMTAHWQTGLYIALIRTGDQQQALPILIVK